MKLNLDKLARSSRRKKAQWYISANSKGFVIINWCFDGHFLESEKVDKYLSGRWKIIRRVNNKKQLRIS